MFGAVGSGRNNRAFYLAGQKMTINNNSKQKLQISSTILYFLTTLRDALYLSRDNIADEKKLEYIDRVFNELPRSAELKVLKAIDYHLNKGVLYYKNSEKQILMARDERAIIELLKIYILNMSKIFKNIPNLKLIQRYEPETSENESFYKECELGTRDFLATLDTESVNSVKEYVLIKSTKEKLNTDYVSMIILALVSIINQEKRFKKMLTLQSWSGFL